MPTFVANPDVATSSGSERAKRLPREVRYRAEDFCRLGFVFSDLVAIFGALILAYYARFDGLAWLLPPKSLLAPSGVSGIEDYAASILLGATLLLFILFLDGAYENRFNSKVLS